MALSLWKSAIPFLTDFLLFFDRVGHSFLPYAKDTPHSDNARLRIKLRDE